MCPRRPCPTVYLPTCSSQVHVPATHNTLADAHGSLSLAQVPALDQPGSPCCFLPGSSPASFSRSLHPYLSNSQSCCFWETFTPQAPVLGRLPLSVHAQHPRVTQCRGHEVSLFGPLLVGCLFSPDHGLPGGWALLCSGL